MTVWQFFDNHWFLAFLAIISTASIIHGIIRLPILLIHGWPPVEKDD